MKEIKIGKITIGEKRPAVIIAEVACEHRGNMDSAKRLIKATKDAGADIVKFQLHVPKEEMVSGSIKFWAGSMDDVLKEVNFEKLEQHKELKDYCEEIGIQYLCTPFCNGAVDILEKIGIDAYKIGSGELTNFPMIKHVAGKRKPIIISTGMSTLEEISDTVKILEENEADFILMHCLSEYPAKYEHLNLGMMPILKKKFNVLTGYSDHTNDIYAAIAAIALGAKVIEKHFTIRDLHGPDDLVSLDPPQFREMANAIRKVESALGSSKQIYDDEKKVRNWAHHSIVSKIDILAGTKFTEEILSVKRPGTGIESKYLYSDMLIGKKAKRDLSKDTILQWEDVV